MIGNLVILTLVFMAGYGVGVSDVGTTDLPEGKLADMARRAKEAHQA